MKLTCECTRVFLTFHGALTHSCVPDLAWSPHTCHTQTSIPSTPRSQSSAIGLTLLKGSGLRAMKFGRLGAPHQTVLKLSEDERTISWDGRLFSRRRIPSPCPDGTAAQLLNCAQLLSGVDVIRQQLHDRTMHGCMAARLYGCMTARLHGGIAVWR